MRLVADKHTADVGAVDDNVDSAEMLGALLEMKGHDIRMRSILFGSIAS